MRRAILVAVLLAACGGEEEAHTVHAHEDEQGHHDHHHESVVGITVWSDSLELFAEHAPAVAGEPLELLTHLTRMEDFRALDDATVRLTLSGPEEVTAEATMARSGIYALSVTPPAPGTYAGRLDVIEGGEGSVDGFQVVVHPTAAAAEASVADEGDEGITFLKEQQWRVPFATARAERGAVAPGVQVPGELGTPPGGQAHVHASVAGRVMAGRAGFPIPGQRVEAGEELATLAPTPGSPEAASQARSDVVAAEVRVEEARAELARSERLLADQAVPARRVAEARRALRSAEAALGAARRGGALYASASRGRGRGTWRVTTPVGGVVDEVRVSPGEAVEAAELLFRVTDPSERWLTAFVPEAWATRIRPAAGVTFHLVGDARERAVSGQLVNVSNVVDERTRTVAVIWALEEPAPELRVGAAVEITVPSGDAEAGVVVPRSAIVEVEGRSVAYVQTSGESFEERALRLGASDGLRTVVQDGIEVGERVVTEGGYLVRLASTGAPAGAHGHGHPH